MQAVILAAGKSTRTYPLTLTRPKPLLKVANKAIIEHTLDSLNGIAGEAIIIVGYRKNQIKKFLGSRYKNISIKYVGQKKQLGTGHALSMAEKHIRGRFIMLAGDDIYLRSDIRKCIKYNYSILTSTAKNPRNFGVIIQKNDLLVDFVEKPLKFVSDVINTSLYCFDKKVFQYLRQVKKSQRGEIELPDAIKLLSKHEKIHCVKSRRWIPIGYPWDVINADRILRNGKNNIAKSAKIHGKIKNSSIGEKCIIYGDVKNSIIMDGAIVEKGSIVNDSVIGNDVSFSGKIISAKVSLNVNGKKIKAGKFGSAVGDGAVLENVTITPGIRISPNSAVKNKAVSNDI